VQVIQSGSYIGENSGQGRAVLRCGTVSGGKAMPVERKIVVPLLGIISVSLQFAWGVCSAAKDLGWFTIRGRRPTSR
jgi:hypothetical protein